MKKMFFFAIINVAMLNIALSQEVVYSFDGDDFSTPSVNVDHISCSDFLISTGNSPESEFPTQSSAGSYFVNEPYVQSSGGWYKQSVDEAKYYYFTISGGSFNISRLKCSVYSTGAGPSAITITINGEVVGQANLEANTMVDFDFVISDFDELSEANIRIIGWDNLSRETSGSGILKIDDVEISTTENIIPPEENQSVIGAIYDYVNESVITIDNIGEEISLLDFYIKDNPADTKITEILSFSLDKSNLQSNTLFKDYRVYLNNRKLDCNVINDIDKIQFNFKASPLVVDIGDSSIVSVTGVLNSNSFEDQLEAYLKLKKHISIVSTDASSDIIDSLENDIVSHKFTFNVVATVFEITSIPKVVGLQHPFEIEIKAFDKYQNIDKNYSGDISVKTESGDGEIQPLWEKHYSDNGFVMSNIKVNKAGFHIFLIKPQGGNTLLTEPIFIGDANSVVEIVNEGSNNIISSQKFNDDFFNVFPFKISDIKKTDTLSTVVKSVVFNSVIDDVDLREIIDSVKVTDEYGYNYSLKFSVRKSNLFIEFQKGVLAVASDNCKQLFFVIKVNNVIDDGQLLSFYCSDISAYAKGSQFLESVNTDNISDTIQLDVVANKLCFTNLLGFLNPADSIKTRIVALDNDNNIDVDFKESISIKGENITNKATQPIDMNNGVSNILVIKPTVELGKISYSAYSNSIQNIVEYSSFVSPFVSIFLDEDFESYPTKMSDGDWSISQVLPIAGNNSLKHNVVNDEGVSSYCLDNSRVIVNSGDWNWSMDIKSGDWTVDANNCWFIELCDSSLEKIVIGVNYTGTDDMLNIWSVNNKGSVKKLLASSYKWQESESARLNISLSRHGILNLYVDNLNDSKPQIFVGQVENKWLQVIDSCILNYRFTEESASKLWVDNLRFSIFDLPAKIEKAIASSSELRIEFNEAVDTSQFNDSCLLIDNVNIEEYTWSNNLKDITVNWNSTIPGTKALAIKFFDFGGNESDSVITVIKSKVPEFRDFSLSEIMYNPASGQREFIEVYNNSNFTIDGSGCEIQVGDEFAGLTPKEIAPKSYSVIVSESGLDWALQHGEPWITSNLPSLSAEGDIVKLICNNKLIDLTKYDGDFYNNKTDKGFSLERVDLLNNSFTNDNWIQSRDSLTVGSANSVSKSNPDIVAPSIIDFKIVDQKSLLLQFSEPIDTNIKTKIIIESDVLQKPSVVEYTNDLSCCQITFQQSFDKGIFYNINVDPNITDWCGNKIVVDKNLKLFFSETPKINEVVINEILFNPYPDGDDFVEIYNNSDNIFDMSTLKLGTYNDDMELSSVIDFETNEKFIFPNEYIVLCPDIFNVQSFYSSSNDSLFVECNKFPSFNDNSGYVVLLNIDDVVIDEFSYSNNMHFAFIDNTEGVSLERINPLKPTNNKDNWHSAAQSVGFATPGLENSHYNIDEETLIDKTISIDNKRFSPDNDGFEDRLEISYKVNSPDWRLTAKVYNSSGVFVARAFNGLSLSLQGKLYWDGMLDDYSRINAGIYFIVFSLYSEAGENEVYKEAFVAVYPFK
ncbi:MAG: lamin tail domain-containing protein [Bacteroidales bacterium]|nr:lamin tail domain-containing protein [Bacteroidales bacterium]